MRRLRQNFFRCGKCGEDRVTRRHKLRARALLCTRKGAGLAVRKPAKTHVASRFFAHSGFSCAGARGKFFASRARRQNVRARVTIMAVRAAVTEN
jgi:hypothetical protein